MTPILHPYAMRALAPAGGIYDPLSPPGGLRIGYRGIYAATPARMILLRSYGPNVAIHPIVRPAAGIEPTVTLAPGAPGAQTGTFTITPPPTYSVSPLWGVLGAVSVGLSAFHGYRRNNSIGWGITWGVLGGLFPVVTPAIAFAQGFGKRKNS